MHETIARSGLKPDQIDRVLRTGGSSQIPLFVRLLEDTFGRDKVLGINTFSSVTSGLAIIGHEIETGQAEYPLYTPDSVPEPDIASSVKTHRGVRPRIDLAGVRQQLQVTQGVLLRSDSDLPYMMVMALDDQGGLSVAGADQLVFGESPAQGLQVLPDPLHAAGRPAQLVSAWLTATGEDDQVLLITNEFKLTFVPARAILIASRIGAKGIHDLLRLQSEEYVTAMTLWNPARVERRFMCLVTDSGQVRRFEAALLAGELRQAPYFRLERKYKGHAAHLVEADEQGDLVLGTGAGRIARIPIAELGNVPRQGMSTRPGERVTAAAYVGPAWIGPAVVGPDAEWLAVGHSGQVLPLRAAGTVQSQSWKGARLVGFASRAQMDAGRVLALTAQGTAWACSLPSARALQQAALVLPLVGDGRIVSLLFLED